MDLLASLNPQQRIAVMHGKGPALVLAGAGSGKTRVIAYRVAYLIRNGATRAENILAVTFTNKAAQEMRERVRQLLGPVRRAEPLISTFHSFCVRILRREIHLLGYRNDFSIYDTDDQKRLMKQILTDLGQSEAGLSAREILRRISFAKNHNVPPSRYASRFQSPIAEDIQELYRIYDQRLRQSNALDFDDLLLKAVDLMEGLPNKCQYYSDWFRYILVDEYQDTNRPQYELLKLLTTTHQNLFVVGDEDQSIYRFRGADIGNILRFEEDFPGAKVIRLEQNYRSTQNILRVASAVVEHNRERKGKTLWTENTRGDVATCHPASSARTEAVWAASRMQEILPENPDYRIAVLYRANFLSRNFEEVLTQMGIPYAVVGSVAFFGRMEVKDVLAYLRVIFNPEDDISLLRIINTPARAIGSSTIDLVTKTALEKGIPAFQAIQELSQDPQKSGRAARVLAKFYEMLNRWMALRDNTSMADLLTTVVRDTGYIEMLRKQETAAEAESRIANIEELSRAAAEAEVRGETVFEFLDRASLSSELDRLDPNARVVLMTLHSAKGLEFDVVFLVGLEEGLFPHSLSLESTADLEEERRLCYVGITRARHKLYITWTPFRRAFGGERGVASLPSRFLHEMPGDLIEGLKGALRRRFVGDVQFIAEEAEEPAYHIDDADSEISDLVTRPSLKSLAHLRSHVKQKQKSEEPETATFVFKPGMRVRHEHFGDGIVLSRQRVGEETKLTVTFTRVGRKTLIQRYAKLQPLSQV